MTIQTFVKSNFSLSYAVLKTLNYKLTKYCVTRHTDIAFTTIFTIYFYFNFNISQGPTFVGPL